MPAPATTAIHWWQSLDPPIYLISVLPGAAVWLLAGGTGQLPPFIVPATLAVILLQHAINVLNDVSDWRLGADVEKSLSWVHYHQLDLPGATLHGNVSLLAGAVLGLATLLQAQSLYLLGLAVPLVVLGYLYNSGPRPLSYTNLGEWVTGLCYGPGVFGSLWMLASGHLTATAITGSVAFFALATALLLSHQPAQIETDRQAGKLSFAVRFGARRTRRTARVLYLCFLLGLAAAAFLEDMTRPALVVYGCSALVSGTFVVFASPSPRRILTSATTVVLLSLLAAWTA